MSTFSWSRAGDSAQSTIAGTGPQSQKALDAKPMVPILDQMARVREAWDPTSANCAFQHYFYNRVPAEQAQMYAMPPGQDQAKWEKALAERPDATCVPVLAVGFDDLQTRLNQQNQQINAYRVRMHELNEKLNELSNRHDLHTSVKLLEMKERQLALARKTLALIVKLEVLTNRGWSLTPDEELYRQKLKELLKRAEDPAVFGSLNEVGARIKAMNQTSKVGEKKSLDWDRDSEQLESVVRVLAAHQTGIKFLSKLVSEDSAQVDAVLKRSTEEPKKELN